MREWSKQFSEWSQRPRVKLLSALIFLKFLVLSVTQGRWLTAVVWVAFLAGSGFNYLTYVVSSTQQGLRKSLGIAAGVCFVVAVLMVAFTLLTGRS